MIRPSQEGRPRSIDHSISSNHCIEPSYLYPRTCQPPWLYLTTARNLALSSVAFFTLASTSAIPTPSALESSTLSSFQGPLNYFFWLSMCLMHCLFQRYEGNSPAKRGRRHLNFLKDENFSDIIELHISHYLCLSLLGLRVGFNTMVHNLPSPDDRSLHLVPKFLMA